MIKVAIIGCGASGTMTLANLVRFAKYGELEITVFHHGTPLACGIAYSTQLDSHLLNVTASEMGVWAGNKNDFYEWLQKYHPGKYHEKSLVPRKIFGEYLKAILAETKHIAETKNIKVIFINQEITKLPIGFDHICLALGNKLRKFDLHESEFDVTLVKHIAIAGTGLSMIDVALWLDELNYREKITLISLNGKLPYPHSLATKVKVINTARPGDDLATVLEKFRQMVEQYHDWRSVVDSFHTHCNQIWHRWSLADKKEFLTKYNSEWGLLRHRIALEMDQQTRNFFDKIKLEIINSKIDSVTTADNRYKVILSDGQYINCDKVINCMGLNLDARVHPIYADLINKGVLRASDVKTGVVPPQQDNLHIIGSALIGYLFESIAIPDLRHQAVTIARKILSCH